MTNELERYGIRADRKGFARCPFHNEKTASFRVYPDNTFHCFGCGAHGDVITFVMKMQGVGFLDACARLDGDVSYSEQRKIDKVRREREKAAAERDLITDNYFAALDRYEANEALIKEYKPLSMNERPLAVWFMALNLRSKLQYELEMAESEYMKGGV